jgi:hypothetical protein
MKTISEIRHANLLNLIQEAGGVSRLAEKVDRSHSQISQLKNRSRHSKSGEPREMGDDIARHIEQKCALRTGWMDTEHPVEGGVSVRDLYEFTVPPITKWEDLMQESEKAELIRVVVQDDALPNEAPKGSELIMSTKAIKPRHGEVVLVRDQHGMMYLRLFAEGRAGAWRAIATGSDGVYLNLDSSEDGLKLIAVAEWTRARRP